jgi:hypothetical protein
MKWVWSLGAAVAFAIGSVCPAAADDLLPSRDLGSVPFVIDGSPLVNFDLVDVREELEAERHAVLEGQPRSIFMRKRHVGAAVGGDNGLVHASIGFYWTVAEWKRLNFGVPAIEVGFGRYPEYDAAENQTHLKFKPTLIISLASIHYRVGYIKTFGLNCYLNFEQVHDLRVRFVGSQFGVSFSKK